MGIGGSNAGTGGIGRASGAAAVILRALFLELELVVVLTAGGAGAGAAGGGDSSVMLIARTSGQRGEANENAG